jgi:hypothetical protein
MKRRLATCSLVVVIFAAPIAVTGQTVPTPVSTNPAASALTNVTVTVDGVRYENARLQAVNPATVKIWHSTGIAVVPTAKLPAELQKQFGYDAQLAAQWQAAQQKAAAEAADARQKAAASVEWKLTVESVLPGGLVGRGCQTSMYCPQPVPVFLVNYPRMTQLGEGEQIIVTAYRQGAVQVNGRSLEKWVYHETAPKTNIRPSPAPPSPAGTAPTPAPSPSPSPAAAGPVGADVYVRDLANDGAFGFPQPYARILCNRPNLRFSVWNNDKYLFAQAVLWTVENPSLEKDSSGYPLGDYSHLMLDLDNDGTETPDVDRAYWLNQRPFMPGLRYVIWKQNGTMTGARDDSEGRGALRFVATSMGKRARVDTYLIPLQEISKHVGDTLGIYYYAYSPQPHLWINSLTLHPFRPNTKYQQYTLSPGGAIDPLWVPEGRNDTPAARP